MVQPTVHVLTTTYDATRAALATAIPLAKGSASRLVVIVITTPNGDGDVSRYRDIVEQLDGTAQFRLCICHRPDAIVDQLLPRRATVVVGGAPGGLVPTAETRLVRRMTRLGHRVIFVPVPHRERAAGLGSLFSFSVAPLLLVAQLSGFVDVGVLGDVNAPSQHLFRNRGTTPRVDEVDVDMAALAAKKSATDTSRWGAEVTVQTGEDAKAFGFSATAPNIAGADVLRHFGPTDVSYVAPVGEGLTIQGGIFASLIGYDSLYAKDNASYTRPWGADYTPYLMLGVNASYPVTPKLTATAAVVNGYWHLADANDVPSLVGQIAYKPTAQTTIKQTLLYGPHQADTSLEFWRVLSDTIVERKTPTFTAAFEYQLGAERVDAAGQPLALWMSTQLPLRRVLAPRWSATIRPELAWDRDGRWIGAPQSVRALTTTVEYRLPVARTQTIVRVEHRYDNSHGSGGGFFEDDGRLTASQHLFIVAAIVTFESSFRD